MQDSILSETESQFIFSRLNSLIEERGGRSKQDVCIWFALPEAFVLDFHWEGGTMVCFSNQNRVELKHYVVTFST